MEDQNKQQLKEDFKKLPKIVQDIITESDWQNQIRFITSKHNLRIDQGADLENIVFFVMLGYISPEEFRAELIRELGLSEELVNNIYNDTEELIFSKIKKALIEATEEQTGSSEETEDEFKKVLSEIEDPEEDIDHSSFISKDYEPRVGLGDASTDKPKEDVSKEIDLGEGDEEAKTSPAPENIPVGDIKDVPRHGHGHQENQTEQNQSTEEPDDDIISNKFSGVVKNDHESVNLNLKNKTVNDSYKGQDPYREAVN